MKIQWMQTQMKRIILLVLAAVVSSCAARVDPCGHIQDPIAYTNCRVGPTLLK